MANTTKENKGTLNVKFRVTAGGKDYKVGNYNLKGKEYDTLKAAPYVTEVEEEKVEAKKAAKTPATKDTGNGGANDNQGGNDGGNDGEGNEGGAKVTTFTKEELEALEEDALRALYTAECAKAGKNTPPKNIKVATIIANLTK